MIFWDGEVGIEAGDTGKRARHFLLERNQTHVGGRPLGLLEDERRLTTLLRDKMAAVLYKTMNVTRVWDVNDLHRKDECEA